MEHDLDHEVAEQAAGRNTTVVGTRTADPLAAAIVLLDALYRVGLGPAVLPSRVADAMDAVATACSPYADISVNPAKDLAIALETLIRRAPEQWHLLQPNWPSDYDALGIERPAWLADL